MIKNLLFHVYLIMFMSIETCWER